MAKVQEQAGLSGRLRQADKELRVKVGYCEVVEEDARKGWAQSRHMRVEI